MAKKMPFPGAKPFTKKGAKTTPTKKKKPVAKKGK